MPRELKCSMEEFFVPDAKDREVATRMAPDGSTLPGANKVCTSEWRGGDNIEVYCQSKCTTFYLLLICKAKNIHEHA